MTQKAIDILSDILDNDSMTLTDEILNKLVDARRSFMDAERAKELQAAFDRGDMAEYARLQNEAA